MTDNDWLLSVLSQANGWLSQEEILRRSQLQRGHGLTVHSRAADLRKRGHIVENKCERRNGRAQSFYRLVALEETPVSMAGVSSSARRWSDCPECAVYYAANRSAILHAAASVGIERGLTTNVALSVYMTERHEKHAALEETATVRPITRPEATASVPRGDGAVSSSASIPAVSLETPRSGGALT